MSNELSGSSNSDSRKQERRRIQREVSEAIEPIIAELRAAGLDVSNLLRLPTSRREYRTALPILMSWLPRVSQPVAKEEIVRALSKPAARPTAAPVLVAEFKRVPPTEAANLKWAVGNALSVVADDSVFEEVVELLRDHRHGKAREMLPLALANKRDPRAVDLLIELLEYDEIAGHAIIALGKLKVKKARKEIERFLVHPKSWVRTEAKRALAKIDKAK
jgi:HEAT repeat protein